MKLYDIYGKLDHDGLWIYEPDRSLKLKRREEDLRDLMHDNFKIRVRKDTLEDLQEYHPHGPVGEATKHAYDAMKSGDKIQVLVGSKAVVVGSRVVEKNKFAYYPSDRIFDAGLETAKLLIGGCPNKYIFELVEQEPGEDEYKTPSKNTKPGVSSKKRSK